MPRVTEKKVIDLIDLAYESALDPTEDGWKAFWNDLAGLVSCDFGGLHVFEKSTSTFRSIARSHDPVLDEEFNAHYYDILPYRQDIENLAPGEAFDRRRDFPDDKFLRSEIYRAFFEPIGVYQCIHQKIHDDEKFSLGIGFLWPAQTADLDRDANALLGSVFPHIRRAMDLYLNQLRQECEKDLLKRAIAEVEPGILIVTESGKVLLENETAERLLAENAGIFRDTQGRLTLKTPDETREFKEKIARMAVQDAGDGAASIEEFNIAGPDGNAGLEVKLTRIEAGRVFGIGNEPHVLITIRPLLSNNVYRAKDLRRLYGLTPAEERLARMIAEGHSVSEACEILNVSPNTARTHLKRVFSKTDTHRQSSLVKLILS